MSVARILQYAVLVNAVILLGVTVYVIALYGAVYSATKDRGARLLPLHVWIVAFALLGYVFSTTYFLMVDAEPLGMTRAILYGTCGAAANYGLWNVLRYDRRKLTRATGYMEREHGEGT